jgi:hypothetical protein
MPRNGVALAVALAMCGPVGASPLTLVQDGHATAAIVVPARRDGDVASWTTTVERHTAAVLGAHVRQISDAVLPVIEEADLGPQPLVNGRITPYGDIDVFIVIGDSALARSLGVTSEGLTPGGFRMRTVANALVIVGHPKISNPNHGGGVRQAAVTILESLGCRYLWPGESGKVVPRQTTIAIASMDMAQSPAIQQRRVRYLTLDGWDRAKTGLVGLGLDPEPCIAAWTAAQKTNVDSFIQTSADIDAADFSWVQWHGLGGDIGLFGGHAFNRAWKKWGAEHPEWFALQADGTRDQSEAGNRSRLCVSNPGLIRAVADDVLAQARRHPEMVCFSLCPNDGGYASFCLCEQCESLDPASGPMVDMLIFDKVGHSARRSVPHVSLTDRYVYFWNRVAEAVAAERPDLLLLVQAYSIYSDPPVARQLHPNLVLRYVPSEIDGWDGWRAAGATRVYWRPNILWRSAESGELFVQVDRLAGSFAHLAQSGMLAIDIDSVLGHWSTGGLNYYAAARLCWDPTLSADEIIDDYCRAGFGAAAPHVNAYFQRAQQLSALPRPDYRLEHFAQLRGLLNAAEASAVDDQRALQRIAFLRLGLNHTALYHALVDMAEVADDQAGDADFAWQLMDLNHVAVRDLALSHPMALNVGLIGRYTGNFRVPFRALGWKGKPSADLLDRVDEAAHHLTGRENSFYDMAASLNMPTLKIAAPTHDVEADGDGRVIELDN